MKLSAAIGRARLGAGLLGVRYTAWPAIAVAACAVAIAAACVVVLPLRDDVDRMTAELARRPVDGAAPIEEPDAKKQPRQSDTTLDTLLPSSGRASTDLEALFDLARQHQLRSRQAEYQTSRERHARFESLQVSLPLTGSYPSIREWVEAVLRTMPHASVDQIAFERESIGTPQITARIKLTLWFRPGQVPAKSAEQGRPR